MDRELDVFSNYRSITNKIKKRFLKKPNFNEASEQFATLTRVLKHQECAQYAGFCCLAKARCENTLGNCVAEAEALLEAARLFFQAEKVNIDAKCAALDEHLPEAIHCYNQAVKGYSKEGRHAQASIVALELAQNLLSIGRADEAHNHFVRAAEMQRKTSIMDSLCTLRKAAYCQFYLNNLPGALTHLSEVMEMISSMVAQDANSLTYTLQSIRQSVEITFVFIMLLLKSSPMELSNEHSKVMETYTWENEEENNRVLPEDLFLLIQSVVMATNAKDVDTLTYLQVELYPQLDTVQCELFQKIIHETNE
ncbi:40-kDa huntingtin-associated protein-like [Clytia hemisphaerica]|uniref:Factor VIII intron 22 protein n=1 Tax=Clytia hemisphaerica TaxID=252671 RepID=A0A7M5XF06_9CNID